MTEQNKVYGALPPLGQRVFLTIESLEEQLRDVVHEAGMDSVILGLSGGIDSAVVATLAVRALGPKNVRGVLMPSPYSSEGSIKDALELAQNLGIKTDTIPIQAAMTAYKEMLTDVFQECATDTTEENIQARIRANILMAISNKFGGMVLATCNRSELLVGYGTLYGDMVGGFAPIGCLYKGWVYEVAEALNASAKHGQADTLRDRNIYVKPTNIGQNQLVLESHNDGQKYLIPHSSIEKEPSAELSAGQKDSDSLPPYPILDAILYCIFEETVEEGLDYSSATFDKEEDQIVITSNFSAVECSARLHEYGFARKDVKQVFSLVRGAFFKQTYTPPISEL